MGTIQLSLVLLAFMVSPSIAQWRTQVSSTSRGNSPGRACVFPFIYKGVTYNECITLDNEYYGNVPWCSTTGNYDSNGQWAVCEVSIVANRTRRGNAGKSTCELPFIYKGRTYSACTTDDYASNKPWCATSPNYDRDRRWAECVLYEEITVTGGNVPDGTLCNLPYIYRGVNYHGCITANNGGVGWCATTSNYDTERLWGNCVVTPTTTTGGNNNCPNGNTYSTAQNTLSYGGTRQGDATTTVQQCQSFCDANAACLGFDFDRNQGVDRCYIHTNQNNFNVKETSGNGVVVNVDQYTLTNRCTTNPNNPGTSRITTRGGNAGRSNACSFPYIYRGQSFTSCTSRNWYTAWCAVTPNYDRDRRWGECSNVRLM